MLSEFYEMVDRSPCSDRALVTTPYEKQAIYLFSLLQLRKFIKTTNVPKYRKQLKQLVDKVRSIAMCPMLVMYRFVSNVSFCLFAIFPLIDRRNSY